MAVNWNYYNQEKFNKINKKYLPNIGEGETMATQAITCINKLIYRYYNDGDIYDNNYYIQYYGSDISDYANWLYKNIFETQNILEKIKYCNSDSEYENILKELAEVIFDNSFLEKLNNKKAVDSIYDCEGQFSFNEYEDDDENEF